MVARRFTRAASTTLCLVLSVLATSNSLAASLTGWWSGTVGGTEIALALKEEKNGLTGSIIHTFFYGPLENVRLQGHSLAFDAMYEGNPVPFKGELADEKLRMIMTLFGHEFAGELQRMKAGEFPALFTRLRPQATEFREPVPKVVDPGPYGTMGSPPSDAIVLFDGKDLSQWRSRDGSDAKWDVHDGVFTVRSGTGNISTRQKFEDYQLHLEWQVPTDVTGHSQMRGNSGLFLQDLSADPKFPEYLYEIQILDSYQNPTYVNGQAGAIYKQSPPLVNASRPPGQWNVYDVIYSAPSFRDDGSVASPARVTLLHNGVLVQDNFEIRGHTPYIGIPRYFAPHGKAPITLQDHWTPISFRNIWIRER